MAPQFDPFGNWRNMASGINFEPFIGLPFVLIPGMPPDHVIAGETHEGVKLRVGAVQMVWNDMLLMDAIQGPGTYVGSALPLELACIEVAERLYRVKAADAVKRWVLMPKLSRGREWPTV
jgi:hypothetical protein